MRVGKLILGVVVAGALLATAASAVERPRAGTLRSVGAEEAANIPYLDYPAVFTGYLWNGGWNESTRSTTTRDGQGRVVEVHNELYLSGWTNSSLIALVWSSNDGPDTVTTSLWISGVLTPIERMIYSYDGQGYVDEETYENYFGSVWMLGGRTMYTRNGNGDVTEQIYQAYFGGFWSNQMRTTISYNGTLPTERIDYTWNAVDWAPMQRTSYTYAGGRETERITEFWNGTGWQTETRTTITYDGNRIDVELVESNFGGNWTNSERTLYESYDAQDRPLVITQQLWNGSSFENLGQQVLEYDLPTSVEDNGVSMLPNGTALSQNYPNPFNPSTQISFTLPSRSEVTVEVFDVLGRRVAELFSGDLSVGDHTVEWNGRNSGGDAVASGVYFYRLTTDQGSLSRKMLLVK